MRQGGARVVIMGSVPPPIGGVTTHIARLYERSQRDSRVLTRVLDFKKRELLESGSRRQFWVGSITSLIWADIVHIQISSSLKVVMAFLLFIFGKKVVYTHHNARPEKRWMAWLLVRVCRRIILVNGAVAPCFFNSKKIRIIPAFIAPSGNEDLRHDIKKSVENADIVVSVNAYDLNYVGGEEVYGMDVVGAALQSLNNRIKSGALPPLEKKVAVLFLDPSNAYGGHFVDRELKVDAFSFQRFVGEEMSFFALLKKTDICLRPTRTDGDPLTVREALYLGVKTIASDVTPRPDGVITFQSGSSESFESVLEGELRKPALKTDVRPSIDYDDFYEDLINVYLSIDESA